MLPFPSNLPPQTILDCILDPNWRDNGILHVLDVLQWKGQDVGDCETPFRLVHFSINKDLAFTSDEQILVERYETCRTSAFSPSLEYHHMLL